VLIELFVVGLLGAAILGLAGRVLVAGIAAHLESDDPSPAPTPSLLTREAGEVSDRAAG
jgi:hypothetical protein